MKKIVIDGISNLYCLQIYGSKIIIIKLHSWKQCMSTHTYTLVTKARLYVYANHTLSNPTFPISVPCKPLHGRCLHIKATNIYLVIHSFRAVSFCKSYKELLRDTQRAPMWCVKKIRLFCSFCISAIY